MAAALRERRLISSGDAEGRIGDGELRVWAFSLDVPPSVFDRLAATLAPDEQARAARFVFDRDRRRYTAARGWLRSLLGRCLGSDPTALRFAYSATGKPSLAPGRDSQTLHFNLAHSGDLAVVAVTRMAPLGVDVERLRPLGNAEALVARFFSPRENRLFQALPPDRQKIAFFNLWTRKEALLKATGAGLSKPLHLFEVSFLPGDLPQLLAIDRRTDLAAAWRLEHLSPRDGFVGAVAIERAEARVLPCEWLEGP